MLQIKKFRNLICCTNWRSCVSFSQLVYSESLKCVLFCELSKIEKRHSLIKASDTVRNPSLLRIFVQNKNQRETKSVRHGEKDTKYALYETIHEIILFSSSLGKSPGKAE